MKKVLFSEKQYFPKWMAGLIFFMTLAILVFSLFMIQEEDPETVTWIIPVYIACMVPVALPFFIGVEVKITEEGVYYRSLPFQNKLKFVSKNDATFSFQEAGIGRRAFNYGINYRGVTTTLLAGKYNLKISTKRRTILIGTKKHRELQRALENLTSTEDQSGKKI